MSFNPCSLIASLPSLDPDKRSDFNGYHDFCQRYQLRYDGLASSQHLGQISVASQQIAVHLFRHPQPRGSLLIVHGYLDHHGLYQHLIRYGLERQLNVIGFDLPGHGLSSGTRAAIDSFDHYQQVLHGVLSHLPKWRLSGPLHLLGQSTGAAIINHFLLAQPRLELPSTTDALKPDGQVALLAPLLRPHHWYRVKLAHALLSPWKASVQRDFAANSTDPAFNTFLPTDPLQSPVITTAWVGAMKRWLAEFEALPPSLDYQPLLIQGQQDNTVDWRYNLPRLKRLFPRLQTLTLPRARHQLANESVEIRQQYLSWLDQQGFARSPETNCSEND
tara:strand:+ start:8872 stop:9867 length:996 start_codon:yes stop_codon:yes gene_type:complete